MQGLPVSSVIVKSYVSGRVRLKSKNFDKAFFESLQEGFMDFTTHCRINEKCHSIIILFDEAKISLEELVAKTNSLLGKSIPKTSTNIKQSVATCCALSCSTCKKATPTSWGRKILTFVVLSAYAIVLFVQENFGSIFLPLLPTQLTMAVALFAAIPLLKEAWNDIKNRRFTLQTFMAMSLLGAIFLGEVGTAFEVIYILRGGMLLEEWIAEKSKVQIRNLIGNDIKKAYVLVDGLELETDLEDVKKGDIVAVRSGEKIPVDGVIVWGEADISEAMINGRSEPCFKKKEDEVFANTLVEKGRIHIQVNAIGDDTYLSRVIAQVELSLQNRSPSEKAADILATRLLKLGTLLTGFTFLITGSFMSAFSVMIVMSCPCATILAASTAVSAGIARAAKNGILIKGGEYLENFSKCDIICFDKTGTLTTGKPVVVDMFLCKDITKEELFFHAALAEYRNSHPIALSIIKHANLLGLSIDEVVDSEVLPGLGAKAKQGKNTILVGNSTLFKQHKIPTTKYQKAEEGFTKEGKTVVYVSKNREILGFIVLEHESRKNANIIVSDLKKRGVKKVILLTGDDTRVAHAFAKEYNFDEVYANIMPSQKADIIKELKKDGSYVAMIGDGINDTIALSEANVGVSFASGGSEAAIEVSDIAITKNSIDDIVKLYDLSKKSLKVVEQNYWIGTSTNMAGVAFAALGSLSPAAAGVIHIVHTIGIMANASKISFESDNNS